MQPRGLNSVASSSVLPHLAGFIIKVSILHILMLAVGRAIQAVKRDGKDMLGQKEMHGVLHSRD